MVAEPWIQKMRKKKNQIKNHTPSPSPSLPTPSSAVGILSFEVATAMSRAVHLHRSLADPDRLSSLLFSPSVLSLVSADKSFLVSLAVFEKLDDLNRVATAASRLGRTRCPHLPALSGFEHVYSDLLRRRPNPNPVGSGNYFLLSAKEMDSAVRRMERFVSSTSALYAELEVLSDLEHSIKKIPDADGARRAFEQKIHWQRHDLRQLRESSLWNQTFDRVVLLLCRAVCTIHARIRSVFGESAPDKSPNSQGNAGFRPDPLRLLNCGPGPGRLFLNCLGSGDTSDGIETETVCSAVTFARVETVRKSSFGPKSRLTTLASAETVGGSCLALHYANVIIIIEKLLRYPHLVGDEARDDLYSMLPSSLKLALRKSLRSYAKNLAIYDASLAHDWKGAMETILSWLAPMAHNMIRWQTERNFEQQRIVTRENVLLLQTLYFADREKTEAAVCELLVGLNYICRYEQQQNALLDCTSSVDFDDCMDWQQMQFHSISERS